MPHKPGRRRDGCRHPAVAAGGGRSAVLAAGSAVVPAPVLLLAFMFLRGFVLGGIVLGGIVLGGIARAISLVLAVTFVISRRVGTALVQSPCV